MARAVPFFFCRYQLLVDEEVLSRTGQLNALTELQGQYHAHGPKAEKEGRFDSAVMRPRAMQADGEEAIFWSVGQKIGVRFTVGYDADSDEFVFDSVDDPSIRYSDFVALPRLGVLAVDDRAGDNHLGGKAAINRFRSIFRNLDGGAINISLTTSPDDVSRAMQAWELTEFSFVARPYNPHPRGELSRMLSEQFAADGIGRYRGKARPAPGGEMRPAEDGHIAAVVELADAGYGQYSLRGVTEDGHTAQIKQPRYEQEVTKNQRRQAEPRELRVFIQPEEDTDDDLFPRVATALKTFYDREST